MRVFVCATWAMAEAIITEWDKLNLSEEEQRVVGEDLLDVSDPDSEARLSLLVLVRSLHRRKLSSPLLRRPYW